MPARRMGAGVEEYVPKEVTGLARFIKGSLADLTVEPTESDKKNGWNMYCSPSLKLRSEKGSCVHLFPLYVL